MNKNIKPIKSKTSKSESAGISDNVNSNNEVAALLATQGSVLFTGADGIPAEDNASLFFDDANNQLGLLTNNPTHSLTIGHTSTGIALYGKIDQKVNYERLLITSGGVNADVFDMRAQKGGTGILRTLRFASQGTFTIPGVISPSGSF